MVAVIRYNAGNIQSVSFALERVKRFVPVDDQKVPHMGWNQLTQTKGWINKNLEDKNVYYVHSYYVPVNQYSSAVTTYSVPFSAALQKDNFYAVQFHPEKSAE